MTCPYGNKCKFFKQGTCRKTHEPLDYNAIFERVGKYSQYSLTMENEDDIIFIPIKISPNSIKEQTFVSADSLVHGITHKLSTWVFKGTLATIKKISDTIPTTEPTESESVDQYVIGIQYKQGDFQLGLTEKFKEDEQAVECIIRSVAEETGLLCTEDPVISSHLVAPADKRRTQEDTVFSVINASTLVPLETFQSVSRNDNRACRAAIFIVGSKEDLLKLLNHERLYPGVEITNIVGFVLIKVRVAKRLAAIIEPRS